jgi:hypothetical protein
MRSAANPPRSYEEKLMTGMKTSIAVLAMSAALSGPVLAQGGAVDSQTRSKVQGEVTAPRASGGAKAGADTQVGVPGARAGVKSQTDTTGTLGTGGGAVQGSTGASGKAAVGGKRTQP